MPSMSALVPVAAGADISSTATDYDVTGAQSGVNDNALALPAQWVEVIDDATQQPYFYNSTTGESTCELHDTQSASHTYFVCMRIANAHRTSVTCFGALTQLATIAALALHVFTLCAHVVMCRGTANCYCE
jgi:WW domain